MAMSTEAARVEFSKMRAQISTIAEKVNELDQERNEYDLVVKALRPMEGTRKCYRLVGGVLVERTVSEVLPAIETNLGGIDKLVQTLMEQLKTLEKAAEEFRTEHDLAFSRDQAAGNGGDKKKGGAAGVLV